MLPRPVPKMQFALMSFANSKCPPRCELMVYNVVWRRDFFTKVGGLSRSEGQSRQYTEYGHRVPRRESRLRALTTSHAPVEASP